jgi:hypothetical protein
MASRGFGHSVVGLHRGSLERGLEAVGKLTVMIDWECVARHSVIELHRCALQHRLGPVGKIAVMDTDRGCLGPQRKCRARLVPA